MNHRGVRDFESLITLNEGGNPRFICIKLKILSFWIFLISFHNVSLITVLHSIESLSRIPSAFKKCFFRFFFHFSNTSYGTGCSLVNTTYGTGCSLVNTSYGSGCSLVNTSYGTGCSLFNTSYRTGCSLVNTSHGTGCSLVNTSYGSVM